MAKAVSEAQIQTLLQKGLLSGHAELSADPLERIRNGAAASARMSLDHADILIEQGLIEC